VTLAGTAWRAVSIITADRSTASTCSARVASRAANLPVPHPTSSTRSQCPGSRPGLTARQVRVQAASALPEASVRRLALWRYELLWRKPATG
jgi:hypothetical protein